MTIHVIVAVANMFLGYTIGMIAGEIRVKTFWGGFTVSSIALCFGIASAVLINWWLP